MIVVGAGPAGAFTAYNLAQANLNVLLLDKERLPRYKSCGGAVSLKVQEILTDFKINNVIEDEITKVVFSHNFQQPINIDFLKPFTYMVMRDKLDDFLVKKAQNLGVKVIDNNKVVEVIQNKNQVQVNTNTDSFTAQLIVGADGAKSVVASDLGLMTDLEYGVAYEKELKVSERRLNSQRGIIHLDYGIVSNGYVWVFPKAEHLSVGVGTYAQGIDLKGKLNDYLVSERLIDSDVLQAKGHLLPIGGDKHKLNNQRGLVVGDAAGLVDPLSGEGIFYALKSAQLASKTIVNTLSKAGSLDRYTELVNQEILPEFKKARLIGKIFFPFSKTIHKLFNKKEWILKQLLTVIYGGKSYSDLYNTFRSEIPFLRFKV